MYLINIDIFTPGSNYRAFEADIRVGGSRVTRLDYDSPNRGMHANAVIAFCDAGKTAYIRAASSGILYGSGSRRTMFSGHLLSERPALGV